MKLKFEEIQQSSLNSKSCLGNTISGSILIAVVGAGIVLT